MWGGGGRRLPPSVVSSSMSTGGDWRADRGAGGTGVTISIDRPSAYGLPAVVWVGSRTSSIDDMYAGTRSGAYSIRSGLGPCARSSSVPHSCSGGAVSSGRGVLYSTVGG